MRKSLERLQPRKGRARRLSPGRVCLAITLVPCFALGCVQVLGDFVPTESELEASVAGESGIRDATPDPQSAKVDAACTPNTAFCQGRDMYSCTNGVPRKDGTCPYLCDRGQCVGLCLPGDTKCETSSVWTCQNNGTWALTQPCPILCVDRRGSDAGASTCAGDCLPGSTSCNGAMLRTCDANGAWKVTAQCPFACLTSGSTAECAGVCTPTSKRCVGNVPQACDANGAWVSGTACPNLCGNGLCTGACSPPTTQCNGDTLQTCVGGAWMDSRQCPFVCKSGACGGQCAPNATRCASNLVIETCGGDGIYAAAECPFICDLDAGACKGQCKPGDLRCSPTDVKVLQHCTMAGTWETLSTCTNVCYMGSCQTLCTPGTKRCSGNAPQICDSTGAWIANGSACANGCLDGGVCVP